jgi:RNA polymerase sigma factor (sigma-70 family)
MSYRSEEEKQAFLAHFQTLYPELGQFAGNLLGDEDEGPSIVLDKMIKCYDTGLFAESEEVIRMKLFTAVRNGCIDHLRKLTRRKKGFARMPPSMNPGQQPISPENAMVKAEFFAKYNRIITELPPEIKPVIVGNFMHELSVRELAIQLNTPESTIYSNRKKGIDILRERFKRYIPEALEVFEVIFGD